MKNGSWKKWLAAAVGLVVVIFIFAASQSETPGEWYHRRMATCDSLSGIDQERCRSLLIHDAAERLGEMQGDKDTDDADRYRR